MTEATLPSSVLSWADGFWSSVTEELQKQGIIPGSHKVVSMDVHVETNQAVTVSNIESEEFDQ